MDLRAGQFLNQSLQLNMTQELIQSISLLQYSSLEMVSFINKIMEENPLIEVDFHFDSFQVSKRMKNEIENINWIDRIQGKTCPSLTDYMHEQILGAPLSKQEFWVLDFLIQNLDRNGYLDVNIDEFCKKMNLNVNLIERMVTYLQQLDPPGIGARNLQECLFLQLKRNKEADYIAETILFHYFEEFAERKWSKLSRETKIPLANIKQLMMKIHNLHPRPGARWDYEDSGYVLPDVIIEWANGQWHIFLMEDVIFTIKLNKQYLALKDKIETTEKDYYRKNYQQYKWLKRSVKKRKETMLKLAEVLIEKQGAFFLNGTKTPVPMTMENLAVEIGVHCSTVSRIAKNKYIRTPRGTFLLKDLFTTELVHGTNHEGISVNEIKIRIKAIIENEDKSEPLSDQNIAKILKEEGISVSRRVIAKYRDKMMIPSSVKRKEYGN